MVYTQKRWHVSTNSFVVSELWIFQLQGDGSHCIHQDQSRKLNAKIQKTVIYKNQKKKGQRKNQYYHILLAALILIG